MAYIAQHYADLLEQWENESYEEECGCDWLEEVGESVKFYALECAAKGKTPTFKGLIEHLGRKDKLMQRLKEEGSQLVTNCHQLKMRAADGKNRLTDVSNAEAAKRAELAEAELAAYKALPWYKKIFG